MKKALTVQLVLFFLVFVCTNARTSDFSVYEIFIGDRYDCYLDSLVTDSLITPADTIEVSSLLYMREEEKLARDVYIKMHELWGMRVFNNISYSEQRHTDAVLSLMDYYGIADIVNENSTGVFVNDELQALYDTLVASGSKSEIDALKAGALIEEIDITDLKEGMDKTDKDPIITVYSNLKRGSENHMRAFVRNLSRRGVDYKPQVMDENTYSTIINSY